MDNYCIKQVFGHPVKLRMSSRLMTQFCNMKDYRMYIHYKYMTDSFFQIINGLYFSLFGIFSVTAILGLYFLTLGDVQSIKLGYSLKY